MKNKLATPVLIACALFFGMNVGTGLYEHMFGIPQMLRSPTAMVEANNNNLGQAQRYWIPLHGLILITLISSLIFNWKNPGRKKLLLWTFIGYVYISIVSIFFAKELFAFKDLPDGPEFYRRTKQWIALSWHRPILMLFLELLLLIAISRPALKLEKT
jgi:hypothetical protein